MKTSHEDIAMTTGSTYRVTSDKWVTITGQVDIFSIIILCL